ncbi:MAG: hypothetical protein IPM08_07050 [Actinomycetales bacterium]|nr:hypothetical protein [Actinomycetales bacterium]
MWPKGRTPSRSGVGVRFPLAAAVTAMLAVALSASLVAACTVAPNPQPAPTTATTTTRTKSGPGGLDLAALPVGSSEHALTVGGLIRMYRVYRPAQTLTPPPVVVMLHGGLGTARATEQAYGWDALADREGFLVVYPDAVGLAWNVGNGCCGIAPATGVDDVDFIAKVMADIGKDLPYDKTRVYATGMSTGGMMAYRLACDTTLFAAVAPVAATLVGDCTNPAPLSVMHVHGTADTTVPYAGVSDPAAPLPTAAPGSPTPTRPPAGLAAFEGRTIPDLMTFWRNVDRCGGTISHSDGPVTVETAQCAVGRTVSLVLLEGGGHEWPGVRHTGPLDASPAPTALGKSTISGGPESATGLPTTTGTPTGTGTPAATGTAYSATPAIWEFFAAHVK